MRQALDRLETITNGIGLYEITEAVTRWTTETGVRTGLLTVFMPHTSASLLLQENADPSVRHDLQAFFQRLVIESPTPCRFPPRIDPGFSLRTDPGLMMV